MRHIDALVVMGVRAVGERGDGRAHSGDAANAPTFTKDIAPIFQEKCEACHRPDSIAPMSLVTYDEARPWARSIKARVADRQMPPWHIDKTVGIQNFKNDRSLDRRADRHDRQAGSTPARRRATRRTCRPPKQWPDDQGWNFAAQFGQKEPDLIIKSYDFTMPAGVAGRVGQARHAVGHHRAALGARDRNPSRARSRAARSRITRSPISSRPNRARSAAGSACPAPFMEWAVGKQGEMMRPDTGKLLLPGSKFRWDIHYSQAGEEITNQVELGIYFYPKGQEPKFRTSLSLVPAALGTMDIRPNTVSLAEGFTVLRENGAHRELPAAHAPARQGDDGRGDPAERAAQCSARSATSTSTG